MTTEFSVFEFEAIGTHWKIDIYKKLSLEEEGFLLSKILERIDVFDKNYSRFRSDSLITEMSKHAGQYDLPDDAMDMFSVYKKIYDITSGKVTPLIGNVLVSAGYDAEYSLKEKELVSPHSWNDVLEYSFPKLVVKKPVMLDFGAGGKGYLVDIVGRMLQESHIESFCIDAGGDMLYLGKNEDLRVGLENPLNTEEVVGVALIRNESICGSAGNRRRWGKYHHIIDPVTLESVVDVVAVWVVADKALVADILTTALFFVSPEKLVDFDFEYCIIRSDNTLEKSDGFVVEAFGN